MKKTIFTMILFLGFINPSFSGPLRDRFSSKENTKEQKMIEEKISIDGIERTYFTYIPSKYNESKKSKLLFAFHGGGGSANYQIKDDKYGIIQSAENENSIVVIPNGYSKFKNGMIATWNAGNCCGDARDLKIDDTKFIKNLIDVTSSKYNIDKNKIFATGMSNGGMMAYQLACFLPNTFKGIAVVAGTNVTNNCPSNLNTSLLHIHAENDTHVLFNGGAGDDAFKDKSKVTDFPSIPLTIDNWRKKLNLSESFNKIIYNDNAYCDIYENYYNKLMLCVTKTGGHSWPGVKSNRILKESPSQDLHANYLMWDFFNSLQFKK